MEPTETKPISPIARPGIGPDSGGIRGGLGLDSRVIPLRGFNPIKSTHRESDRCGNCGHVRLAHAGGRCAASPFGPCMCNGFQERITTLGVGR